jgi:hypothetical protein
MIGMLGQSQAKRSGDFIPWKEDYREGEGEERGGVLTQLGIERAPCSMSIVAMSSFFLIMEMTRAVFPHCGRSDE